ncbi:uncharacterized protein PHA67_020508 [Liasis olivaceus]
MSLFSLRPSVSCFLQSGKRLGNVRLPRFLYRFKNSSFSISVRAKVALKRIHTIGKKERALPRGVSSPAATSSLKAQSRRWEKGRRRLPRARARRATRSHPPTHPPVHANNKTPPGHSRSLPASLPRFSVCSSSCCAQSAETLALPRELPPALGKGNKASAGGKRCERIRNKLSSQRKQTAPSFFLRQENPAETHAHQSTSGNKIKENPQHPWDYGRKGLFILSPARNHLTKVVCISFEVSIGRVAGPIPCLNPRGLWTT